MIAPSNLSPLYASPRFPIALSLLCLLCRVWFVVVDLNEIIGTTSWQHPFAASAKLSVGFGQYEAYPG